MTPPSKSASITLAAEAATTTVTNYLTTQSSRRKQRRRASLSQVSLKSSPKPLLSLRRSSQPLLSMLAAASLCSLLLILLAHTTVSVSSERHHASAALRSLPRFAPPSPPLHSNLEHLAKSPASALLLSDFLASERQRVQPPSEGAVIPPFSGSPTKVSPAHTTPGASLSPLSSDFPQFSQTLDGSFRLDEYHPLEEIYSYIDALPKRYKQVQVFTIGRTAENRPIKALELINNATDADFVWLDGLTHAREWITGTTLLYIIDQLVSNGAAASSRVTASTKFAGTAFTKNYIIVPVVNPDGYVYTWTTNRMWRKNRSRSSNRAEDSKCIGTDLNRNFDHASFGGEGASNDVCSHIFAGSYPLSEHETKALSDLMWSLKDRIKFYLTIHSYNQLWACPYAHTTERSASYLKHMRVLRSIQRAVYESEGVQYEIGPLSTSLYVGSGFGIDFAYDKCGIEHSYLVELRDKGANGFVLPPDQIMPTARETMAGLRAGLRSVFGGAFK